MNAGRGLNPVRSGVLQFRRCRGCQVSGGQGGRESWMLDEAGGSAHGKKGGQERGKKAERERGRECNG